MPLLGRDDLLGSSNLLGVDLPAGERRPTVEVRLKALYGTWETCGVDRLRGIVPENLSYTANAYGSDTATFDLRRKVGYQYPDLTAYTPVDIIVGGVKCWAGRVKETPTQDGLQPVISVSCEGWQYHLDDDVFLRSYVQTDLTKFQDVRGFATTTLGSGAYEAGYSVGVGDGTLLIALPPAVTSASNGAGAAVLDLGLDGEAKRVVVTYIGGGKAGLGLQLFGASTTPTGANESNTLDASPIATTSTVASFTFTTARRYVVLQMTNTSGGALTGDQTSWVQITACQIFRSTAYESGNASVLKASDVVKDALTLAPLLNQSTSGVTATSTNLPDYALDGYHTARDNIDAVNAYHAWNARVDVDARLIFEQPPSYPVLEFGEWSGAAFSDASQSSGQDIYSRVIVEYTQPDGTPGFTAVTQSGTAVDKRAFTRTVVFSVNSSLTSTAATVIGSAYLANHKTAQFKGSVTVSAQGGVRRVLTGEGIPPHELPLYVGQRIRHSGRIDPDTGAQGRDGAIVAVSYDYSAGSASVSLDNTRNNFDALMARLALFSS